MALFPELVQESQDHLKGDQHDQKPKIDQGLKLISIHPYISNLDYETFHSQASHNEEK
jgi:hypothetical protein